LFVHGATIPSAVVFDAEYQDYSWMKYLAQAGLDVFALDQTGYGRSTRPSPMEDPCNAAPASQAALSPFPLAEPCPSSYTDLMTTIASDWDDLDTVVDYLRALRQVDKVSLVAWSRGGPRAGGYAGRHPEKIDRLVMLAPAYLRGEPEPETLGAMTITTQAGFESTWNTQIGCADQYDPQIRESLWSHYLESDSTAALWGRGVGRAPSQGTANTIRRTWGLGAQAIAAPTLLISGDHDVQVPPDDVRTLYEDLRMTRKVFAGLACSSHNAAWELPHLTLFQASAEWLLEGTVNGRSEGLIRLGD
jgi:pimeloyl-ACP methyl ester carboxylesterase